MKPFKDAYELLQENAVIVDSKSKKDISFRVFGKTDNYIFRIYLKTAAWFSQCGCKVGVSNKPTSLCKHHIASIVRTFLEVNNLELVKK